MGAHSPRRELPSPSPDEKGASAMGKKCGEALFRNLLYFSREFCAKKIILFPIAIKNRDHSLRCLSGIISVVVFICKSILGCFIYIKYTPRILVAIYPD
jgi:hypothetical protein